MSDETGERGDTGSLGPAGETGETGDQGEQGYKGGQGDRGPTGDIGQSGDVGERGDHGKQGYRGDTGVRGERGPKGDPGQRGDQGRSGDKGEPGESSVLTRNVTQSFIILVLVSVGMIAFLTYQARETRHLTAQNGLRIAADRQLRKQADRNQVEVLFTLCHALNQRRDVIADLFANVRLPDGNSARTAALQRLKTSKCPPKP